jgi:phosphatidylserine/phosphatidylglycerophosphate/cardiolipin synthase-like enzyme
MKMFGFSDTRLLNAVFAARRRGVKVQVMLNDLLPKTATAER